jgi:hypothetical protein
VHTFDSQHEKTRALRGRLLLLQVRRAHRKESRRRLY